jgi:transposase
MPAQAKIVSSNQIEPRRKRRKFSGAYKARIVSMAAACSDPGEVGALLRREGLYSSHLSNWREQARAGSVEALGRKRGPKKKRSETKLRAERLEREVEALKKKLEYAEEVIEIPKKLSRILGVPLNPPKEPDFDDD